MDVLFDRLTLDLIYIEGRYLIISKKQKLNRTACLYLVISLYGK